MNGHKLKCSNEEYRALQIARQSLISAKIWRRELESYANELRKAKLHERALKYEEVARRLLEDIRYWEKEIRELEAKCFGEK